MITRVGFKQKNISIINNLLYTILLSLWVTPYYIRGVVLGQNIRSTNIIGILALSILFIIYLLNLEKGNRVFLTLICILSLIYTNTQLITSSSIYVIINYYLEIVFPLILLDFKLKVEEFPKIFRMFLKIFNLFVIILLALGVIDFVDNHIIISTLVELFNDIGFTELVNSMGETRYFSFMGHPLYNCEIFLIFFIINNLNNKYFKSILNPIVITLISIIGIALTGSKTGLVLIILGVFVLNIYNKKVFIFQIVLSFIALYIGIFNTTIERFNGSLTTGRNEMWEVITSFDYFPIKFFNGYGSGFTFKYNNIVNGASAAFEYPARMFSLEYGILFTIILYVIFTIPLIKLLRRKHYFILMGYMIVFVDINTYNGIALAQDHMLMSCLILFIMINMSNYLFFSKNMTSKDK
ncbi:oligosaccharide repeat unit polymerase [Clostridium beijerinckii]|uniref:oligosaccharide repeat unit polymerase n=1 Tax=Clostridium beijerinckii TaxID=1520 RepID=UPI00047E1FFB|nr:oligosaccharide repeat unit polymerase [Clostridium beijerinckii]